MKLDSLRTATAVAALFVALGCTANTANASLAVNATVGGAATGVNYVNFDNLPLGIAGGMSGGVGVSFAPDGQVAVGGVSGIYAPPFISGSNGVPFGDNTVSGADGTQFITTGIGSTTLTMPGNELYLGLLWGSVDLYNTLKFYMGATLVGTLTGGDIVAAAAGDQGVNGTYYANIVSTLPFDSVVASSSQYAFEFDNVAYNPTNPNNVPEPLSLGLLGIGLLGTSVLRRRKAKV